MLPARFRARVGNVLRSYWTPAGKKALGNLLGLLVGVGVGHACAFGGLLVLTAALGADGFGCLSVALIVQTYLWTVAGLGMGGVLLREVGRHPANADRLVSTFLILQLAAAAIFTIGQLIVVAYLPLSPDERALYLLFGLGVPSLAVALTVVFDAAHRQAVSGFVVGGCEAVGLVVVLLLWHFGVLDLPSLGVVYLGKWLLMTGGQWAIYRARVGRIGWAFDRAAARVFLASGWPLMLTAVMSLVPLTAGVFVVRWQAGDAEAGRYGLAAQFANAVLMVGTLGNRILLPHVNGEHGLDHSFVRKLLLFGGLFWGGLAVGGAIAGAVIVNGFLPPDYADAVLPLILLCAAVAFQLAGQVAQGYLVRANRERFALVIAAVAASLLLVGSLVVGPQFGALGAAAVALFTCLSAVVAYNFFRSTTRNALETDQKMGNRRINAAPSL